MTQPRLPLRGISVFEAVARLGSFKAAAEELSLTPSAVSHQIRSLELELGVALFAREGRGVKLSAEAAEYAKILQGLLARMRVASDNMAAKGSAGRVRIMTPPSLATHWLIPRLPALIAAHPDVDMRVFAVRTADGRAEDFDITIGYGDAARWQARATPLLEERTQPYCAPSRLGGAAALTARQLLSQSLIRSHENELSWEGWFAEHGIVLDAWEMQPFQIDPSYVAIEAAVKGIGVILESSLLTREHVEAGRLVAPVLEESRASVSYWLLPLRPGARRSTVVAYDWLLSQSNCRSLS